MVGPQRTRENRTAAWSATVTWSLMAQKHAFLEQRAMKALMPGHPDQRVIF